MMFEAEVAEFPFVAALPKREKSKAVRVWESFREISRITEKEGVLIPQGFAARLLDVSQQRVSQLSQEGRLKVVEINGHPFVTENSCVEYAQSERKAGRPPKLVQQVVGGDRVGAARDLAKVSWECAREMAGKGKAKKV